MPTKEIRLFLADDHPILRDGIKELLNTEKDIIIVGEANNGIEVLERLSDANANVLLLDIDMPLKRGIEIITELSENFPEVNVLVFTMHENDQYANQMMKDGAKGYILKSARKEILIHAIRTVALGDTYLSNEIANRLFSGLKISKNVPQYPDIPLTNREIEVLKLVANSLSNQEIASSLFISIKTVATHRKNIMQKLNLHNAVALTRYAVMKKLMS
jgi:DNA-binding NarL/FixJ family response regulator